MLCLISLVRLCFFFVDRYLHSYRKLHRFMIEKRHIFLLILLLGLMLLLLLLWLTLNWRRFWLLALVQELDPIIFLAVSGCDKIVNICLEVCDVDCEFPVEVYAWFAVLVYLVENTDSWTHFLKSSHVEPTNSWLSLLINFAWVLHDIINQFLCLSHLKTVKNTKIRFTHLLNFLEIYYKGANSAKKTFFFSAFPFRMQLNFWISVFWSFFTPNSWTVFLHISSSFSKHLRDFRISPIFPGSFAGTQHWDFMECANRSTPCSRTEFVPFIRTAWISR